MLTTTKLTLTMQRAQSGKEQKPAPGIMDILCMVLPIVALIIWSWSLPAVHVQDMSDLGLVSAFPPSLICALIIMTISFGLALNRPYMRVPILVLHIGILILMLYGVSTLVEAEPRFDIVYRHAGYTEYIMRTGTVDPYLDAYFNWPGFFILSAFLTKIAGYTTTLQFSAWAPVFYNVIYFGPIYMMATSFGTNKRITWLTIWFFYLTNWIGQDYFSPQGLFFFFYLAILAMYIKWFKMPADAPVRPLSAKLSRIRFAPQVYAWLRAPDTLRTPADRAQRIAILIVMVIMFIFVMYSHQLTPFAILTSLGALVLFRRGTHWWLPIVLGILTMFWVLVMAHPYIAGHAGYVFGAIGNILGSFSQNVGNRVAGSPEHTLVARLRLIMTAFVWALAAIGALVRLRNKHQDATVILLAVAPFLLVVVQPYGGEMMLRSYMFSLAPMCFLVASIFYHPFSLESLLAIKKLPEIVKPVTSITFRGKKWQTAITIVIGIVMISGFLITRYGNERDDYKTVQEVNGIEALYNMAPTGSLFVEAWNGTPWQIKDYEKYQFKSLADSTTGIKDIQTENIPDILKYIESDPSYPTTTYFLFSRSVKANFYTTVGLPEQDMDNLEKVVETSKDFKEVYNTHDVQIFLLQNPTGGAQ